MPLLSDHYWIIFIAVTVANGLYWKSNSKKYIAEKPERKEGYRKLLNGWLIYGNIPWIIMGIGMLTGMTKNSVEFKLPSQNAIVIIYFLYMLFILIFGSYWLYFKGGAEMLVDHPGMLFNTERGKEKAMVKKVKQFWGLGILGAIFSIYLMYC